MAQIDYQKMASEKAMAEAFEKMQVFLQSEEGQKIFPEWLDFVRYLNKQEVKIHKQTEQIEAYREFFETLSSFLPRKFSTSDMLR